MDRILTSIHLCTQTSPRDWQHSCWCTELMYDYSPHIEYWSYWFWLSQRELTITLILDWYTMRLLRVPYIIIIILYSERDFIFKGLNYAFLTLLVEIFLIRNSMPDASFVYFDGDKTIILVLDRFYWSSIYCDVSRIISRCHIYQTAKA